MLKIIVIIIGYTMHKFTRHHNIIIEDGKKYNIQIKKFHLLKKYNYSFCQCGN